ncbi:MAG: two component transcriptional regulator, AraC family [Eubacterium sp.]|nr:two component transcriptional regulator, AraC family [Eubacterium sp.]
MNDRTLKVLIVDDESNTRNLVNLSVDWNRLNMDVIGEATSGLEALDLVESLNPDIVITDIQMPYMDGLALSKAVKETHPDMAIVILTAHDEFSYAQSAVSIGVSDFILKPIDKNLLNDTLSRLGEKINSHRLRLNELELSHQYFKNNIAVFQNKVLNDLISNKSGYTYDLEELGMVELGFDTDYNTFQLSLINITLEKNRYTNLERQVLLQNCCSYIKNTYFSSGKAFVFTDIYSNIALLNNDRNISLNDISEHTACYFRDQLSTSVYCGIGLALEGTDSIYSSYNQALNALNMCFITGEEITFADSQVTEHQSSIFYNNSSIDNMRLAIKAGSSSQAVTFSKELLHNYSKVNINDLDGVKILALNICTCIKEILNEMKISFMADLSLSGEMVLDIFKHDRYSDIENTVVIMVEKACALITEALSTKNNSIVSQIKNYVDENFSNYELNLKVVADKFYLNSSYLSRVFKKGTGISFSEYLIKIRMEKAISMLKIQDYKAYQLAQIVGIPDPNYFVKCFKKVVGIPFAEYKLKK